LAWFYYETAVQSKSARLNKKSFASEFLTVSEIKQIKIEERTLPVYVKKNRATVMQFSPVTHLRHVTQSFQQQTTTTKYKQTILENKNL